MTRKVIFSPEARSDLLQIYGYIAERSGPELAMGYYRRLRAYCLSFADFPERGTLRDDLWPGLRIVGFERRVAIGFHVVADSVRIDRILYGGRDIRAVFSKES